MPTAPESTLSLPAPRPPPAPASHAANTHAMLVLHFSHVWSLGGVARALEVGREDWGLSELGRKAGAPPGRGEGRQTPQSSSATAASRLCLCTRAAPAATRCSLRTLAPTGALTGGPLG